MGDKWPYSSCFIGCCFQDVFKTACSIFVLFLCSFLSKCFIKIQVMQLYNSTDNSRDMTAAWKNSYFLLSKRLDFYMVDNLLIAVHAFSMHMLTSLSFDEILLPRYLKWSTNFRDLSFNVVMVQGGMIKLSP